MDRVSLNMIAREDVPALGIKAGDLLRWNRQDDSHSFTQSRRRTFDYGAVLVALNQGKLEAVVATRASATAPSSQLELAVEKELRPLLRVHRRLG